MANPSILYYFFVVTLMLIGLYLVAGNSILARKVVGITVLQAALLILVLSFLDSTANSPFFIDHIELYSDKPIYISALIVVVWGFVTFWRGHDFAIELSERYGSVDERKIVGKG